MENGNLVSFIAYCKQRYSKEEPNEQNTASEELGAAIQHLIERLRECKPLTQIS